MQVSGLVIASDGVEKHGLIDIVNTPLYEGRKFLLREKILNPNLVLKDGAPLIEPAIKAMFDSSLVNDVVVVGNEDQCEALEGVTSRNAQGKPYKIVSSKGHIGEVVATGADNLSLSGYFFIIMPDLPFVTGQAIDFAVLDILRAENLGAEVYLPVISDDFFKQNSDGWVRPFSRLRSDGVKGRYKGLDFVIANSGSVNPQLIRKYYEIRMIHSLRGIWNAIRHFPTLAPEVAIKYATSRLSLSELEGIGSELYGGELRVVKVTDPIYATFMKDIDTVRDYRAYQKIEASGNKTSLTSALHNPHQQNY